MSVATRTRRQQRATRPTAARRPRLQRHRWWQITLVIVLALVSGALAVAALTQEHTPSAVHSLSAPGESVSSLYG